MIVWKLVKIKIFNGPAGHRVVISESLCGYLVVRGNNFFLFCFNSERKLWKVLQYRVEVMRIDMKFEAPFLKYKNHT